ncbi:hypothetical protein [Candidatus Soleaferrea massiliensis]|uniref:hypothetical protein n=1 Tax=Candidatus Soleaferrea massiliensis TaxID=1470354 RepID=UPI0012E0372A|nr:hypothetical protein [Candidatus Soleaferrea massiliensis]
MKLTLKIIGGMVALAGVLVGAWIAYEKWLRPKLVEEKTNYITCNEPDDELY